MRKMLAALTAAFLLTTSFGGSAFAQDVVPPVPPGVSHAAPSCQVASAADIFGDVAKVGWKIDKYEGSDYQAFAKGVLEVMNQTDPSLFDRFDAAYVVSGNPGAPDMVLMLFAKGDCVVNDAPIPAGVYASIVTAIKALKTSGGRSSTL